MSRKGLGIDDCTQVDKWRGWLKGLSAKKVKALYWVGIASIEDAQHCNVHVGTGPEGIATKGGRCHYASAHPSKD